MKDLPDEVSVSLQATFTPNSNQLILAPRGGGLQTFSINDGVVKLLQTIDTQSSKLYFEA